MFTEPTPNTWTCEFGAYTAIVHMFSASKFIAVVKEGDNSRIIGEYKSYAEAEATAVSHILHEAYSIVDKVEQYRKGL